MAAARKRRTRRRRRRTLVIALLLTAVVLAALASGSHGGRPALARPDSPGAGGGTARDGRGQAIDPAAFSPGACRAFGPTSGDRHLTVFLDAGHGGLDSGGVGTTVAGASIDEAELTLPVELDAMRILRADGFRVVVSRTGDTSVVRLRAADRAGGVLSLLGAHDDVAARDRCANAAGADLLIGIYFDAGASAADAGSVTGYDTARPFAAANERLAGLVQTRVLDALNAHGWQIPDDGVLPDSGLGSFQSSSTTSQVASSAASYDHLLLLGPAQAGFFSTPSRMPGAVVEPLYLTDPYEGSIADGVPGQQAIAAGLAGAVEAYFAPDHPSPRRPGPVPTGR